MNANEIAEQIVQMYKNSPNLPRDTRNFEIHGINVIYDFEGEGTAAIVFGGERAPYAVYLEYNPQVGASSRPNRHFGFAEKIFLNEILPELTFEWGG